MTVQHTISNNGRRHTFRAPTEKPFEHFKAEMTRELHRKWTKFMATYNWQGQTVHVRNPGAWGFVQLIDGFVVVELNLESWPATLPWVTPLVLRDLRLMTEDLAKNGAAAQRT